MIINTKHNNISWSQFETCNQNQTVAFENMCRMLFNYYFFNNKAIPHSNPNNPGIEVEPILDDKSNKRISFQSKYLSSTDYYSQIKHSAEQTVKYYSGQLDILYLYCNKDLTTTSKQYKKIKELLNKANIDLVPITNQTILDQVINYPVISISFFRHHGLTEDWFNERVKTSLDCLGPRYNNKFNVNTKTEEYIDLFTQNNEAIIRINQKKLDAINEIKENSWKYTNYNNLLDRICSTINSFDDISYENIINCLEWTKKIKSEFSQEFYDIEKIIKHKKKRISDSEDKIDIKQQDNIYREIRELEYLVEVPLLLEFNEIEINLLHNKILIIQGDAGVGKSQLFANAAEKINRTNGCSLLLLGNSYLSNDPITSQIPLQLEMDFDIDELFNILEGIGQQKNQCVVVFIDAINETGNKDVWKIGLIKILNKLNKLIHVRLAISMRTGYDKLLFDEAVIDKIQRGDIVKLVHKGFRGESVEALNTFLNYYAIPFSPSYFLQHEMTNPLFLTLFCKTYNGEEFDVITLFERIIEKADKEVQKVVGLDGSTALLKYLIYEIAQFEVDKGEKVITKKELFELSFWNTYGLTTNKIPFIASLERDGLLINSVINETEVYFFAYNFLEDYIFAKLIMKKYPNKQMLKEFLQSNLLRIDNGKIQGLSNIDVFIVVCSLYADEYGEECIDIIEGISDVNINYIIGIYINSFLWRKSNTVNSDIFINYINSHPVSVDSIWRVFIENSTKPNHSLNSEKLHTILLNESISHRDYIWTTYINGLAYEDERVFQLIDYFDKGNNLNGLNNSNLKLLLILLSWILTSSNRVLRDKTSKAMIELLKDNFQMCKPLLEKFQSVNDPYVIQRLYGIVFGACMKRNKKYEVEYKQLSDYIYSNIFDKDTVYPDILLRDYARLILERCIYEFPQYSETIDVKLIRPPYRSEDIPIVGKNWYYEKNANSYGFNAIERSMHPNGIDGPGMYGDFGRYVFQSALNDFINVDLENIYHYAMQYIRDNLGYSEELFGEYDTNSRGHYYSRHQNKKTERIGKKYQWISMYNILARISDKYLIKEWNEEPHPFEGSWEPYVRDFDPTLNHNFLVPTDLPQFILKNNKFVEFIDASSSDKSNIKNWAKTTCEFFDSHDSKLKLKDSLDHTWILLYQYNEIKNEKYLLSKNSMEMADESQEIWSMSRGYIVKKSEFINFKNNLERKNFFGNWFPQPYDIYQLFNREYTWSPGYHNFFKDYWFNCEVNTGEKIIVKHKGLCPNIDDIQDIMSLEEKEWEQVETVKRTIGNVMPAYSRLLWEEEYDASQDETTAFYVPCKDIFDYLQLEQKEYDGYFYGKDGTLVSFDGNLSKVCDGLLIRKDYLDKFLRENDLKLFWTCIGEKQCFLGGNNQIWGEWSGFFYLEDENIIGTMENIENEY